MNDADLALLIDSFMRRIHFALQSKAAEFDKTGVGPGGGIVLLTIAEMGCPELNELTKRVARDKSQMSRTIRSMEAKGLVERRASPDDARVSLISLSSLGRDVVAQIQDAVAETVSEILAPITQAEKEQMGRLLRRALR